MDPRDQSIEQLAERFFKNPGSSESDQLDFKASEMLDGPEGKRDLAKKASAIANTNGGTIVVGIGEGERKDIIQSFSPKSEIKRDLASAFRDNTQPPLDQLTSISIEEISWGIRLLRIDIQRAEKYPIEFYDRDSEEHIPYHRVEDSTREMESTDIVEFAEDRNQRPERERGGLTQSITVGTSDFDAFNSSDERRNINNRAILNIDRHGMVIPGRVGLSNAFHKSLTFHTEKAADRGGISGLKDLLNEADDILNAKLGHEFGYAIKYGDQELIGRNSDNYVNDIKNLEQTLRLLGWEGSSDPRPVAIAGTRCDFGFIWFQAQYHTGSLSRIKCGLIMTDIPIDTNRLSKVFSESWFEQHNSLRKISIRTEGDELPLVNKNVVDLSEVDNWPREEIVADNPYYKNNDALLDSIDVEPPETFINALSSVDRLPFDVRGGYSEDDVAHTLAEIEIGYVHTVVPAYFVWAMANPHT